MEHADGHGFTVWSEEDDLGSVVGAPDGATVRRATACVSELLAFRENVDAVRRLLPDAHAEAATILSAPTRPPSCAAHPCRVLDAPEIAALTHLPDELLNELAHVARAGRMVMAAFDSALPVSFAYAAAESPSLWDVSIDTIASHRRRGFGAAAVIALMRRMTEQGRSAVWGAVASNRASINMARRLGFTEVDGLWVMSRPAASRAVRRE